MCPFRLISSVPSDPFTILLIFLQLRLYNCRTGDIVDYSIKIGGEAGQGIDTVGNMLARAFARSGYFVFSHQDYESRIRGGHNVFQIRFADKPLTASKSTIDILVAFDRASIDLHRHELSSEAVVLYDSVMLGQHYNLPRFLDIPFLALATGDGGGGIMANTVATGAILGILGLDSGLLPAILEETLKKKGDAVIGANKKAARAGGDVAVAQCSPCSFRVSDPGSARMLIGTNEAIGLGAIASGCKFYSAYPMTPSTGIMLYLSAKAKEYGIVVEQAEDEIAAINMALGASFAGVRAMTGTSGGGFALMTEGLSLAAMTETPIVIALAQRPAPATGLPTKTEQGDLLFALHGGHGEFPRIIFAPGSPDQAFYLTGKAFDLSQKYQVPVFILTDQYLSDALWTPPEFLLSQTVFRNYRMAAREVPERGAYKRHALTADGVSPFAIPGGPTYLVVTDSDEHDEEGHITEDAALREAMVKKRLFNKLPFIEKEISQPLLYGNAEPDTVLLGWGSTLGIMKEAVDLLSEKTKIAMLHFSEVYPVPHGDYLSILEKAKNTVCVEQNATSQFAQILKTETGFTFDTHINRFDGRPFTVETFLGELNANVG